MFYLRRITAPANTSGASPVQAFISPDPGVIHRVEVRIPPGHAGLTRTRIFQFETQVYPSHTLDSFEGDDEDIGFDDFLPVFGLPDEIRVTLSNADTLFAHDVIVRIGVLPLNVVLPELALKEISDKLTVILRRLGLLAEA